MASNWREWVSDRFGLKPIKEQVLDRRVPKTPWYYGDGATVLLLLVVLVVTGMFMTLTYSPTPDTAYDSVRYITEHQPMGWFVRGLHYWAAGLMMVMIFFHMFRVMLVGGYKFPREGTWLIGVLLLFGVLVMSFTGYLLRWDERAVYATTLVLHMFSRVPLIGNYLVIFVQGGTELGAQTLTRLYAVHVIFMPLTLLMLVGYHLYLVVLHGITSPAERRQPVHTAEEQKKLYKQEAESEQRGETFYPDTAAHSGVMAVVVLLVVVGLTVFYGPQALGPEANLVDPSMPAEEWWYWWYSALIAIVPSVVAPGLVVFFPLAIFLLLVLLPLLDRDPYRGIRKRPVLSASVLIAALFIALLSQVRLDSPWEGWPRGEPPEVPTGVVLTERAEQGRILFAQYGCNSCHPVAGDGPQVARDIAGISERLSRAEFRNYILYPPEGVAMPSYAGRITEEDLELVIEFMHVVQTFPREER